MNPLIKGLFNKKSLLCFLTVFPAISAFALAPNPLISRNKPVFGPTNAPENLVNGRFGETAWNASAGAWAAINVGSGASTILFSWNCTNYMWADQIASPSCPQNIPVPDSYDLLVSSNSTNGSDGTWTKKTTVAGNIVAARTHLVDFGNSSWVKMSVTSGSGWIDEIEVFDASNGHADSWFFAGTSITANAFKGPVPTKSLADLITAAHARFTPVIIRGGIGCITCVNFSRDIVKYFEHAGPLSFFCIEMGTNDGWGGSNANAASFKVGLQKVIDSCKDRNIQPIIARTIATDSARAGWQIHGDFLAAIDDLTASNNLYPGPDLFSWFRSHPSDLNSDGVHPNASGGASIMCLWSEAADRVYATSCLPHTTGLSPDPRTVGFSAAAAPSGIIIRSTRQGQVALFALNGSLIGRKAVKTGQALFFPLHNRVCIAKLYAVPRNDPGLDDIQLIVR
ncbi:MAG: hypothetical protein JXA71_08475 [Chitinispirillaceae bacterium]|nr:hypothetical protein [Chitinispirillaceae bacterium]